MEKKKAEIFMADREYKRSNVMIGAKYKASLLENKINAISLSKIMDGEYDTTEDGIVVSMRAYELKYMIHGNGGSFYSYLEPTARAMGGRMIGWKDPERGEFDMISVIIRARYVDGVFKIWYNSMLREYISDIRANYTLLNLPIMLSFKSDYSFRLYEILKSKAYYPKGKTGDGVFHIIYGLAELKLDIGIVNASSDKVKKVLDGQKNPDYEKAVEVAPEKSYDDWRDFQRWVLKKSISEINEKSDIEVDYTPIRGGRGGKIQKISFTVTLKDSKNKKRNLTEEEKYDLIDEIADIIGVRLKTKDYIAIGEAAEYDLSRVETAAQMMEESRTDIENVTGFLIYAIKEGYGEKTKIKASKKKTSIDDDAMEQMTLDFGDVITLKSEMKKVYP